MGHLRTAYEISESQVTTPDPIVSLFWKLTKQHRRRFESVLDMGAGDCRFANGGPFDQYVGVEIDKKRIGLAKRKIKGEVIHGCVFQHKDSGYDACIGNPPYVRHHDIQSPWKEKTVASLERKLGISFNKHGNLYLYFLALGILKTNDSGLLALVIPYEWVSRPSAKPLREYIRRKQWNVSVYRFQSPIFHGVLTTASISIIDKARNDGCWKYYDITPDFQKKVRKGIVDSKKGVLDYAGRGKVWTLRGLSPGSQNIFTLTEGQRVRAGLSKRDVVPCATSLRKIPRTLKVLSRSAFQKHFVQAGEKCWLIRSHKAIKSKTLSDYLEAVPRKDRQTYTCRNQEPWFKYQPHPVPKVFVSSGFTSFGPKVLINSVGAHAVGSVLGVHSKGKLPLRRLQAHLLNIDFEKRVVAHAKVLKKIEVGQLNAVLNMFVEREQKSDRKDTR